MNIRVTTPPAIEPVTLGEVKLALSIDDTGRDTQLTSAITAGRILVEEYTNRALITQTIETAVDAWPVELVELPRAPLQSVTTATWYSQSGAPTVLSASVYDVDVFNEPGGFVRNAGVEWPVADLRSVNGLVIRYVAGYGVLASDVPRPLREAIIETVRSIVDSDTDWAGPLPPIAHKLARPYRIRPI